MPSPLVTIIRGIGPARRDQLARLGIHTVEDLLLLQPREYEDWTPIPIRRLWPGRVWTVRGRVTKLTHRRVQGRQLILVQGLSEDETGSVGAVWFFPSQYMMTDLAHLVNKTVLWRGKVEKNGHLILKAPNWRVDDESEAYSPLPVYPLTEGLSQAKVRLWVGQALNSHGKTVSDILPEKVRRAFSFSSTRLDYLRMLHQPRTLSDARAARRYFVLEELFLLALMMLEDREGKEPPVAPPMKRDGPLVNSFLVSLPFSLTGAQAGAIAEIGRDLEGSKGMRRMLQGDVGSGKTVVAAYCLVKAAENGLQGALMAPTELLAEQHYNKLEPLFRRLGVEVALLTAGQPEKELTTTRRRLASGNLSVVVGTHALISSGVNFRRLGVVVIDEQHRFGVEQRKLLLEKGDAHLLTMSATPIPRTLALTMYGGMDISVLDEIPPGRQPVDTRWISPADREKVYRFIRNEVAAGRQAYIVYPLIDGGDEPQSSCVLEAERLKRDFFSHIRLEVLHGRMSNQEQDRIMRSFVAGETRILVATTVVEVGVDVPNASVMVIEHADRYGLAQLHQLRGRVGRGKHKSYCLLIAEPRSEASNHRLQAFRRTTDGFRIAEIDLALRGPGEFLGLRQSGLTDLRCADLRRDARLLPAVWRTAREVFMSSEYKHSVLRAYVQEKLGQKRDGSNRAE